MFKTIIISVILMGLAAGQSAHILFPTSDCPLHANTTSNILVQFGGNVTNTDILQDGKIIMQMDIDGLPMNMTWWLWHVPAKGHHVIEAVGHAWNGSANDSVSFEAI
jgi:hypothetical protein